MNTINHSIEIATARAAYLDARAALQVLTDELNAAHPGDTDAEIDAWETAREHAGGYALDEQLRSAKIALIQAGRAWTLATCAPGVRTELATVYAAALGDGRRWSVAAEHRLLDLLCRLDVRTVSA